MKTLDDWVAAVVADLGLQSGLDVRQVLDLARDVAHGVERPAAPVTTYLVGMAVAAGADPADVAERVRALAAGWQD
ncbi:MAG: hypothetical protein QOJ79_3220 [Actinomycetota bacterium]|nr:hypothetical protein [Actinomycetota bacterium]